MRKEETTLRLLFSEEDSVTLKDAIDIVNTNLSLEDLSEETFEVFGEAFSCSPAFLKGVILSTAEYKNTPMRAYAETSITNHPLDVQKRLNDILNRHK